MQRRIDRDPTPDEIAADNPNETTVPLWLWVISLLLSAVGLALILGAVVEAAF